MSTGIEWTNETWNPVTGCDKVSPGCKHCYAERQAEKLQRWGAAAYARGFALTLQPDRLEQPLRWRTPRMVFVNSMSDVFHEGIPEDYVQAIFATMVRCPQHTFQILTKRADHLVTLAPRLPWPRNVWMGVSVESAPYVWRIDRLREVPAAVRLLSLEPLLGPLPDLNLDGVGWVIAGGESGPRRRPPRPEWVRAIRDQCVASGVAFFFKQWGGLTSKRGGKVLDDREWCQYPSPGVLL